MLKRRVKVGGGWAEADGSRVVRIGGLMVPARIRVHFPGSGGQPGLDLELEIVDGVPQCRRLTIESSESGRAVRPLDLSAIRLDEWVNDIYAAFSSEVVDVEPGQTMVIVKDSPEVESDAVRAFQAARKGKGAVKLNGAFFEEVAAVYGEHYDAKPTAAVATHFDVALRTAEMYCQRAREAGLLPPTTRGKKGPKSDQAPLQGRPAEPADTAGFSIDEMRKILDEWSGDE